MKFLSTAFRKVTHINGIRFSSSCKKKDPCECPKPPPKQGIVEEKSCVPCSFWTWKPKPRECIIQELEDEMEARKHPKKCCAMMNAKKTTPDCTSADICPFKNSPCKPAQPEKKKAEDLDRKDNIPEADWDVDC